MHGTRRSRSDDLTTRTTTNNRAPGSMEVQIFGIKKSADTRKALRFFAERRIKAHFVDLDERAASYGELNRFVQKFGLDKLVDRESTRYTELGLRHARLTTNACSTSSSRSRDCCGCRWCGMAMRSRSGSRSRTGKPGRPSERIGRRGRQRGVRCDYPLPRDYLLGRSWRTMGSRRTKWHRKNDALSPADWGDGAHARADRSAPRVAR